MWGRGRWTGSVGWGTHLKCQMGLSWGGGGGGIHWWGEGHSFPMHLLLSQVWLQLIYQRVLKPGVLSPVISYLSNAISWHGLAMNWIMRFVRTTWTYLRYDEPPHVWRTNTITVTNQPTDGASSSIWLSFFGRFYLHGNKQFLDVWPSHSLEKTSTIIHVPTFLFYL